MSKLSTDLHELLTEDVLNMLQAKGINNVLDVLRADNRYIERISPLTFPEIILLKKHFFKKFSVRPQNAFKIYQKMIQTSAIIPIGIQCIDDILNGGIMTGKIYEICGPPNSGKTLFSLAIVSAVLKTDNSAYFLDTRQKLTAKAVRSLFKKVNKDNYLNLMNKLLVKRIETKYQLISALYDILNENKTNYRAIIIDSLPSLILTSSDIIENNNILNNLANILRYISQKHSIAVIVTNLTTTWVEGGVASNNVRENISCGKYWQTVPHIRIKLQRESSTIELNVIKSNSIQKQTKCVVQINELI